MIQGKSTTKLFEHIRIPHVLLISFLSILFSDFGVNLFTFYNHLFIEIPLIIFLFVFFACIPKLHEQLFKCISHPITLGSLGLLSTMFVVGMLSHHSALDAYSDYRATSIFILTIIFFYIFRNNPTKDVVFLSSCLFSDIISVIVNLSQIGTEKITFPLFTLFALIFLPLGRMTSIWSFIGIFLSILLGIITSYRISMLIGFVGAIWYIIDSIISNWKGSNTKLSTYFGFGVASLIVFGVIILALTSSYVEQYVLNNQLIYGQLVYKSMLLIDAIQSNGEFSDSETSRIGMLISCFNDYQNYLLPHGIGSWGHYKFTSIFITNVHDVVNPIDNGLFYLVYCYSWPIVILIFSSAYFLLSNYFHRTLKIRFGFRDIFVILAIISYIAAVSASPFVLPVHAFFFGGFIACYFIRPKAVSSLTLTNTEQNLEREPLHQLGLENHEPSS